MGKRVDLPGEALDVLQQRLPPGWSVEREAPGASPATADDVVFRFSARDGSTAGALVEERLRLTPREAEQMGGGLTRRFRDASPDTAVIVVSAYLTPRTREVLTANQFGYVDLSGNVHVVLRNPAVYLHTDGAQRQPGGAPKSRPAPLGGAKVGRLARVLAEVDPPYGVVELEAATGLSRGYVSRLVDRLVDEGLIRRESRGPVTSVDWSALLLERSQHVRLIDPSRVKSYLSPSGPSAAFAKLRHAPGAASVVVTGSFGAVRKAPVTAPALLALYVDPMEGAAVQRVVDSMGLLPADEGADVVLIEPGDDAVLQGTWSEDGVRFVNLPQLAVDCLSGTGRMPAEGEALLEWMSANPGEWRVDSLAALGGAAS
jgi:hypothetical protein